MSSELLVKLAKGVQELGGRALLVGGSVRDEVLGLKPKDLDVEIYGLEQSRLEDFLQKFARSERLSYDFVGKSFGVYKLGQFLDVSLPRRERKTGEGHKGFEVLPDHTMSVEEALKRRDFTMNAMAKDVLTGELFDPYKGRLDISRKIVRHVDDKTFVEDSLRVLRAVQFAARLDFELANETVALCRSMDLSDLPGERLYGEFEKLLLKAEKPGRGLRLMSLLGVDEKLFPEITALKGCVQEYAWHPEGWSLSTIPTFPDFTSPASSINPDGNGIRKFLSTSLADFTRSKELFSASATQASLPGKFTNPFETAAVTRISGFESPDSPGVTGFTKPVSFVRSAGDFTGGTNESFGVVFKIPKSRVNGIMQSSVNDFEVLREIVGPVAVNMMNMLESGKSSAEFYLFDKPMYSDAPAVRRGSIEVSPTVIVNDIIITIDVNHVTVFVWFITHNYDYNLNSRCLSITQGDVFEHTCQVLDRAAEVRDDLPFEKQVCLMLAALCHDFGKPLTTEFKDGRIRSHAHDIAGLAPTESFLDKLNVHTMNGFDVRGQVLALVKYHLFPGMLYSQLKKEPKTNVNAAIRRMATKCDLDLLSRVSRADSLGRKPEGGELKFDASASDFFIQKARELKVEEKAEQPVIMGRHLLEMGFKPSPMFSVVLKQVYDYQMETGDKDEDVLKDYAKRVMNTEILDRKVASTWVGE